ncbi:hypothetical protein KKG66_11220 [bacterium]|nr:hypothetical protein [bacterium]
MLRPLKAVVLVSSLLALVSGCSETTTKDVTDAKANAARLQQAADEALVDAKIASHQLEWRKFRTDAEITISANDSTINYYRNKIAGTGSDRRTMYTKKIDSLELKNKRLKLVLESYPDSTINTWEQFKRDFSRDMNDLSAALKDFTVTTNY